MNWDPYISKATSKANKTLGFLRRNLNKYPQNIKESACKSFVRPHLEYASAVWNSYRQCHINKIEMVERRAARFVTSNYSREPGTVTSILQNLGWPTLETRRQGARLILLYKIIHGEAAVNILDYIMRPSVLTRQYHQDRFSRVQQMPISTASFQERSQTGTGFRKASSKHHRPMYFGQVYGNTCCSVGT